MTDKTILTEIARNERVVSHPTWGDFIIRRPTNRVDVLVETARTRSSNRDLQTTERIFNPATNDFDVVPAFLTTHAKRRLLLQQGIWSEEKEREVEDAQARYRDICTELDKAGYVTASDLRDSFVAAKDFLTRLASDKGVDIQEPLAVVIPLNEDGWFVSDEVDPKEYRKARNKVEATLKDFSAVEVLDRLDRLQKQFNLYLKGAKAQMEWMVLKVEEFTLFSDTIEMRANFAGDVAKVFYCTFDTNGKPRWKSQVECEESDSQLISWLKDQIDRFERLESSEVDGEPSARDRFNFLSPLGGTKRLSDDSHVQRDASEDGESAAETQVVSTEV